MRHCGTLILGLTLTLTWLAAGSARAEDAPPTARTVDTVDHDFGLTLPDPYRWMEGESNAEFDAWLKAQGQAGRQRLDALPTLERWRGALSAVGAAGVINRLQTPMGGRVFFLRLQQGREGVMMVRDADGTERVLLDPAQRGDPTAHTGVTLFSPSPDGRLLAVNVQQGGSEVTRIEILDVATGRPLSDAVSDVWGEFAASWAPDGRGFAYVQMAPAAQRSTTDPLTDMRARWHRLGAPVDADPVLVQRGADPAVPLQPDEFPLVDLSAASDTAMLVISGARAQSRLCLAPRAQVIAGHAAWNCVVDYADNVQQYALHGRTLYLVSMRDAPNGRLLALPLGRRAPTLKDAVEVMKETPDGTLTSLAAARDALYVRRMRGGPDEVLRVDYRSRAVVQRALPLQGSAYVFNADPRAAGLVITLQDWTTPRAAYCIAANGALTDLKLSASSPADYGDIVAEETTATSEDGTAVPLTILHRKDAPRDHAGTAILEGYGAYGNSIQPYFDPMTLEWVKAGHVYAVAHVRGGGERGDAWHTAGMGATKEHSIEDYIACAKALETLGWVRERGTVAWGASAGGVLVGGAMTREPTRFAAALIQSGMLDPARLTAAKNGANQYAEIGDTRTADGLRAAAAMDPTLRLEPGKDYPPVLLVVGLNDNRVAPWMSGKFGARLMAVAGDALPVWYRSDTDMGHFTTALGAAALEMADLYAFADMALGRGTKVAAKAD